MDFRSGNLALEKQGLLLFAFSFFLAGNELFGKKQLLESVKIITVSLLSFWNLDGYVLKFRMFFFFFFLNPFHYNVVLILFFFCYT